MHFATFHLPAKYYKYCSFSWNDIFLVAQFIPIIYFRHQRNCERNTLPKVINMRTIIIRNVKDYIFLKSYLHFKIYRNFVYWFSFDWNFIWESILWCYIVIVFIFFVSFRFIRSLKPSRSSLKNIFRFNNFFLD